MADPMTDYDSLRARAVSGLSSKTDEARRKVYERACTSLEERLRALEPPISETELVQQKLELEAAIIRVELQFVVSRSSSGRVACRGVVVRALWRKEGLARRADFRMSSRRYARPWSVEEPSVALVLKDGRGCG